MKRFLFLGIAATAMLASCTNDETVEMNPQNAIGFETFVDKSTRATDILESTLGKFKVWAYQGTTAILTGEEVTKSGSDWGYTNTQYWVKDQTYNFHAIAPVDCVTGDSYTYNGTSAAPSIQFTNSVGLTDLIYASVSRPCTNPADEDEVELTFKHLLSRVRFKFTESFPNDLITVKVTDLKITGATSAGTYNGSVWTFESTPATATYSFDGAHATAWTTNAVSNHLYFISTTQNFTISFTVTAYQAGEQFAAKSYSVQTTNQNMVAGSSYEYTLEFNANNVSEDSLYPIEFTVTEVTGWDNFTNVTIP